MEIDEIGTTCMYDTRKLPSLEERRASERIQKSIRVVDGAYEVAVPWKEEDGGQL